MSEDDSMIHTTQARILPRRRGQQPWLNPISDRSSVSRFRFVRRRWTCPRLGQFWDWGFQWGRWASWGRWFFLDQLWLISPSLRRVDQDHVNNPKVLRFHGTHISVSLHHALCGEVKTKAKLYQLNEPEIPVCSIYEWISSHWLYFSTFLCNNLELKRI